MNVRVHSYRSPLRIEGADGARIIAVTVHCEIKSAAVTVGNDLGLFSTMAEIASSVAFQYGVTVAELRGQSRLKSIAGARQAAMWLMYQVMRDGVRKFSLAQIGRYLGERDHTTVIHGIRRHQARLDAAEKARAA